jgi:hypothetical protein
MAHSKEAHAKKNAMAQFKEGHSEKKMSQLGVADGKYTQGEFSNPEELEKSNNALASYAKKNKMKY